MKKNIDLSITFRSPKTKLCKPTTQTADLVPKPKFKQTLYKFWESILREYIHSFKKYEKQYFYSKILWSI